MSSQRPSAVHPVPIQSDPHANPGVALLHAAYDGVWWLAIGLCAPWWGLRCLFDRTFREMVLERLTLALPDLAGARERVLIHGVSVGEVKGALPLVRAFEAQAPELEIVISTTTRTGLAVARQLYPGRAVLRFPLDLTPTCARFLRHIRPRCVVLMELEIWPNFLRECNRVGAPIAVVNGRITERSFARYRWFRHLLPQFDRISLFCVQMEEYARRFQALGGDPARVLITGNMKADGLRVGAVEPRAELAQRLSVAERRVIVAGSTHRPEEQLVTRAWLAGAPQARLVLVPRHPARAAEVLAELAALGVQGELLTELRRENRRADPLRPAIVDTIGELESVYALADLVFVGGSLVPHGGQNMLEPAAQGRAVVLGPHVDNFKNESALLEQAGASLTVSDGTELAQAFQSLLADPQRRARMGAAGLETVVAQKGATRLTFEALSNRCLARPDAPDLAGGLSGGILGAEPHGR